MPAPIAVFAFNRANNLERTLQALSRNELADQSAVTIFCDGPRTEEERQKTDAVRRIARAVSGFAEVTVIEREENWGLKKSLETGIACMFEAHERLIVVEDDIVTSKFFLQYMNDALELYARHSKVASISGYCVPHSLKAAPETFFLRGGECWGWATWKDRWQALYTGDAQKMLDAIHSNDLIKYFNLDGAGVSTSILQDAAQGKVSSWFMPWSAAICLAGRLTLHPSCTLIKNIGFDAGTHCNGAEIPQAVLSCHRVNVSFQKIEENIPMLNCYKDFIRNNGVKKKINAIKDLYQATKKYYRTEGCMYILKKILTFLRKRI